MKISSISKEIFSAATKHLSQSTAYHSPTFLELVGSAYKLSVDYFLIESAHEKYYCTIQVDRAAGQFFLAPMIGYGGFLAEEQSAPLHPSKQLELLTLLEAQIGRRCARMQTSPYKDVGANCTPLRADFEARKTHIFEISDTKVDLCQLYTGNVRTCLRKAASFGVTAQKLQVQDIQEARKLIHDTQAVVGANYQTSEELLKGLMLPNLCSSWTITASFRGAIAAVGIFIQYGARAAWFLSGWDRKLAHTCANYSMVHAAFQEAKRRDVDTVDLGFSSHAGLAAFKERWNPRDAHSYLIRS